MSEHISSALVSRGTLLRRGAAAVAAVAGLPLTSLATRATAAEPAARLQQGVIANVRVNHDHYGVHIEPFVAANPRNPRQLLAACQASHTATSVFIATYLSLDGGATWRNGALPRPPVGKLPAGDDVT